MSRLVRNIDHLVQTPDAYQLLKALADEQGWGIGTAGKVVSVKLGAKDNYDYDAFLLLADTSYPAGVDYRSVPEEVLKNIAQGANLELMVVDLSCAAASLCSQRGRTLSHF